ncbi:histidine N-acetyltransferase-like [Pecten maximus]|uniref:histidine N-acetyltransferase-like n=1 Tax=Pecten maximus TaxID=6579 RepID=UPI001458E0B2|nr:histidine N-acetyltransferase-like [Pecten maximus]
MDSVHFRKATASDYNEVVSLRTHLYNGMDYLPSQYHRLLENHIGYCGCIGNQMVSFMFAALIDDEETIVIRAARVKKEYENKGIYTKMRQYCLHNSSKTVRRESFTLFSSDHRDSAILKGGQLVWQRGRIVLVAENRTIQTILQSVSLPDALRIVDDRSLAELFCSSESTRQLFPEDFIVVNSVPYKIRMFNISHFLTSDRSMYASYPKYNEQRQIPTPTLVSIANKYRCEAGTRFNVDFYGDVCKEEEVSDHIFLQMKRYLSESDDEIFMYVTFPLHTKDGVLLDVLERFSWRVMRRGFQYGVEHHAHLN